MSEARIGSIIEAPLADGPSPTSQAKPVTSAVVSSFFATLTLAALSESDRATKVRSRQAAVLCVDIAGFTPLTEEFSQAGAAGAERLSTVLNDAFGRVIDGIVGAGGDILSFAGDAVWAAWPLGERGSPGVDSMEEAVAAACHAAGRCQAAAVRPMPFGVQLKLRTVVGAGELLVVTSTRSKPVALALGDAIVDAGALFQGAPVGQVVLSPRAAELAERAFDTVPLSSGVRLLASASGRPSLVPASERAPVDAELQALLVRALPRGVVHRLGAGRAPWLAEFRSVSVLFIGLPSAWATDQTCLPELEAAIEVLQACLSRFDGDLHAVQMDEKGLTAIGLFGATPFSHEDDPVRAVRTALAIEAELAARGTSCSIGIASGRVFCDLSGTAARHNLTIAGPAMNLAARLMQSAANSVLCDAETAKGVGAEGGLTFERPKALTLKGKAEAVPAFHPKVDLAASGVHLAAETRREPVGRKAELAELGGALDAVLTAKARRLVVLEGEAGIGKSRVALHFGALAEARGVRVLVASTDGIDTTAPYRGLRSVFERLLGLDALLPVPALRRERVEQALAPHPELARWSPLLDVALGLEPHDNELTARMPEQARGEQTRELLLGILDFEPGPVVLLVEDAHWLDSASLGFLTEALRTRESLLVVLTLRPLDQPSKAIETLLDTPSLTRLALGPLTVAETSELIAARLEVTALPERVAEIVTARSAGNALFSWELTSALRELGLLTVTGDRCTVAEGVLDLKEALDHALETRGVPPTLQGVITSRLDRMSVEQQLVLKVASALGRSVPEALLLDVCRLLEPSIDARVVLRSLDKHDILAVEETAGDATCTFRHAVIKEAIYGTISFKQRERIHRYAAEWYERAESLDRRQGLLGYHWQRAGELERAARYFDQAGLEALREYANEEAISLINASLAIDEARPMAEVTPAARRRRAERRLSLGAGHVAWSKYAESREHLEQGLRGLGRWVPRTALAAGFAILVEVVRQFLYRLFPGRFTGRERARRELLLREARAFEGLTETYFNLGENARCLYAALRSLNLAELAGPSAELARGYASVGAIVGFIPWVERARDYCSRAKSITQALQDRPAEAWVAVATGVLEAGLMQWNAAAVEFEKTYEIGKQLGDGRRCDDSSENVAAIQYLQGDLNRAMDTALRLWESAHRRNDLFMQADSLRRQAYCLLAWNRTAEAFELVQRLTEIRRKEARSKGRELNSDAYLLRALVHARRGELVAARTEAEAGGKILAASSFMFYDVLVEHSTLAEVCLLLREAGEIGPGASRAACRRLTKFARTFPCARPAAELWNGLEVWLSGNHPRAHEHFSTAIDLAQSGGLVYYQGMALYHSGERLDRKEPTRIERLVAARELLERKGERYYSAKAAAALGVPSES